MPSKAVRRTFRGIEGIDFVRCRICGDRRRVISARHLSKHDIDRETYLEEYELSPDDLIAKDFRRIQSSRRDFRAYSKREWLAATRAARKHTPEIFTTGNIQKKFPQLHRHGPWLFGSWNDALRAAGLDPDRVRQRKSWSEKPIIEAIRELRKREAPLYAAFVMKNHPGLFSGAVRLYGSWGRALIAAGILRRPVPRQTSLGLLRELRDLA